MERGLYPIVRLLIEYGVSESAFNRIARSVFVKVAAENIENGPAEVGQRATATRIALMTGIPRGAIKPILDSKTIIGQDEWYRHLCADVLNGWFSTSAYIDERGSPIAIPFAGEAPSFEALVAQLDKKSRSDVSPHAILDELKHVGCVEELPINEEDPEGATMLYARERNFRRVGSQIEDLEAAMDGLFNYMTAKHEVMVNGSESLVALEELVLDANPDYVHLLLNTLRTRAKEVIGSARSQMDLPQNQLPPGADPSDGARAGLGVYVFSEDALKKSRFFATTVDEAEDKKLANE